MVGEMMNSKRSQRSLRYYLAVGVVGTALLFGGSACGIPRSSSSPVESCGIVYQDCIVQEGDTLYEIGRRLGVQEGHLDRFVEMVKRENGIGDTIYPDQELRVPTAGSVECSYLSEP